MNRKYAVAGGLVIILVLAISIGSAFYVGIGPAPGGDSGDTITDFPTATPAESGSEDSGPDSITSSEAAPFSFAVDEIEECGQTCRDVTATLHNNQDETATGVTVYIRIFAGENNTDTDDLLWEGKEDVGSLEAGTSHTTTKRVELALQEARKIDQHDGWITILTSVKTDERTVTFQGSEQVT